jgi:hypothetical protein
MKPNLLMARLKLVFIILILIFFPFKKAGRYDAGLVYYAYECKLIKKKILQYKSSTILDVDIFKSFIKEVCNLFDIPKYAINTLIGILVIIINLKIFITLHRIVDEF